MSNNQSQYQQNVPYKIFNCFHQNNFQFSSIILFNQILFETCTSNAFTKLFFFVRTLISYLALDKSNLLIF